MSTMDNPLLKYNAKEYFFKASLCHFIVDELNAKVTHKPTQCASCLPSLLVLRVVTVSVFMFQLAIEKYEEMFPAFSDSRELKLLKVILFFHLLSSPLQLSLPFHQSKGS